MSCCVTRRPGASCSRARGKPCTLCHTGIVWDPVVDGKRLRFRLAGINNGNPYLPEYEKKGWENYVEKTPAMVDTNRSGIQPHQLMLGVTVAGKNKAYPINSILAARLIQDE